MIYNSEAGFREIEHTADLEIEVWGTDMPSLFRQAAQGLYHLAQLEFVGEQENMPIRRIRLKSLDEGDLLVTFLNELLYLLEEENLVFECTDLEIGLDHTLEGLMHGFPVSSQSREIKAVTYHNLKIRESEDGFVVNIVFDI